MQLDVTFHELGHNFGLQHSTTPGNEYGDCSCAMGACASLRCFNAVQSWILGWSTTTPGGVLNSSVLTPGQGLGLLLPLLLPLPCHELCSTGMWV